MIDKTVINLNDINVEPPIESPPIFVQDIFGLYATSSTTAETATRVGRGPRNIYEQLFIDTSTGTKKLYIYDKTGNVWYSVTIT
jgi:hypothetical protein